MGGLLSKGGEADAAVAATTVQTRILTVKTKDVGSFADPSTLERWKIIDDPSAIESLREASYVLKHSDVPVGFPTETVYGLGADATRSSAVKGIYAAKGRPSDNPLIIHICDLAMLRSLLQPHEDGSDPIPEIYKPLIKRFWPGPLTILLPNSMPPVLAPEVTAGLPTFGARMPSSPLALTLIALAGVPLAAPSANASTKPSPTTAAHVLHDLNGKIDLILDGGACTVGVESTVVDGLCSPPVILRPGGVSLDAIRSCPGWEDVVKGYKDASEVGSVAPRAPGMKYKHYSPKAKVILYEATRTASGNQQAPEGIWEDLVAQTKPVRIGIVRTKTWPAWALDHHLPSGRVMEMENLNVIDKNIRESEIHLQKTSGAERKMLAKVTEISLGESTEAIARGLFAALRELDSRGVEVIYVEGVAETESESDIAAAVMNRLRKAASTIVT